MSDVQRQWWIAFVSMRCISAVQVRGCGTYQLGGRVDISMTVSELSIRPAVSASAWYDEVPAPGRCDDRARVLRYCKNSKVRLLVAITASLLGGGILQKQTTFCKLGLGLALIWEIHPYHVLFHGCPFFLSFFRFKRFRGSSQPTHIIFTNMLSTYRQLLREIRQQVCYP